MPPRARLAAVIGPPPELEVLELELLEEELELELELLDEEELELLEEELEPRPLELLELLLELELEPLLAGSPPQPSRLSTGTATAVVLMMRTILRREAVAVLRVDSSVVVVIVCTLFRQMCSAANYCENYSASPTKTGGNSGLPAAKELGSKLMFGAVNGINSSYGHRHVTISLCGKRRMHAQAKRHLIRILYYL